MTSLAGTQFIELLMDWHTCTSEYIPVEQQVSSHLIFEAALVWLFDYAELKRYHDLSIHTKAILDPW